MLTQTENMHIKSNQIKIFTRYIFNAQAQPDNREIEREKKRIKIVHQMGYRSDQRFIELINCY